MIRSLDRKLLRDLGRMKGQVVAVALVMACGLAVLIMSRSLVVSLEDTRDRYYQSHRFADVFSDLKRAPNSVRQRLTELPDVSAVETRVSGALLLELPGLSGPADGLVVSLPEDREQRLNLIHLRRGSLPAPGAAADVVVSEGFADEHGFEPGDEFTVTIDGARQRLRISGIGLSPEFIYEARPGEALPDNLRFGIFWMNERPLATALGLEGAFNQVSLMVAPGADVNAVKATIDRLLEPYGGRLAYGRDEQISARWLDDEIRSLRATALAFPVLFLGIAAFMSSAVLTRQVRLQREQIAQLKAFGYSGRQIGWHYSKFALVMVLIATVIGGLAGMWMGAAVVNLYQQFFRFPELRFIPDWPAVGLALAASSASSLLGVAGAARAAVRLPPAEAMRPEPPASFRPSALERLGLQRLVTPSFRMALRNLERRPWHSLFTALGLAMATAIPIIPGALRDGIGHLMDFQWTLAQRQDVTLGLVEPGSASAFSSMARLPGVLHAEPFRAVPARIENGPNQRRITITGMPRDATLNRLLNAAGEPVELPVDGLVMSAKLAELMDLKPGDLVRLDVLEGRRPSLVAPLVATITDYSGIHLYMEIDALRRLLGEGATVSGAHLRLDPAHQEALLAEVRRLPRIGAVTLTETAREVFDETTAEMMGTTQMIYHIFAIVAAFGVVYNSARIALSERTRDLATLRVIGFTNREVASVLVGELAFLTAVAIPAGLVLGTWLTGWILDIASTEAVRLPLVLTPASYAVAALVIAMASALSFLVVSRQIRNLDLLAVLNARD